MKYSFIIPTYNSGKYINRCIESILSQEMKNKYEIVIIDGNSTDDTIFKIKKFITNNLNIRCFIKKNTGASAARNLGIKKSVGKYLIFVDSDDIVYPGFIKNIDKIDVEKYDVIKCKVQCKEKKEYDNRFDVPLFKCLSGEKALIKFCISNKIFGVPWSYIIKREFLVKNELYFIEGKYHEDYGILPIVIFNAKSVISINVQSYIYIKRINSSVTMNDDKSEIIRINDFLFHTYNLLVYFEALSNKNNKKIVFDYFYNRLMLKISHLNSSVISKMDTNLLNKIEEMYNGR